MWYVDAQCSYLDATIIVDLIDCSFYRSSTYCVIMFWLILWTVLKLVPILRQYCDVYLFVGIDEYMY